MRSLLTFVLFTLLPLYSTAQITGVRVPEKGELYGRTECEITLKGEWSNPYLQEEAMLDMLVTTPSGREMVVPCFYKGGGANGKGDGEPSLWGARFTPQEKGGYAMHFRYVEDGSKVSESEIVYCKVSGKPKKLGGKNADIYDKSGSLVGKNDDINGKINSLGKKNADIYDKYGSIGGENADINGKPARHGILHVNDNWTFRYDDGTLFRGVGENICWESRTSDDSKFFNKLHEQRQRFSYDAMLPKFAQNGGNFVRIWMCSWNFPIDRKRDFNNFRYTETDEYMNASAIERMDKTLELAEELGVAVMLCMGPGDVRTGREFFISERARARYKDRLRYIVARWGYSPAIGAWEFFNEIDNIQFRDSRNPIPSAEIVAWHTEMARYLKEIDPFGHIVTTSISHRDVDGLNDIADMDVNQKHIYNASSVIPSTIRAYEERFGKPYVIGEFSREWDWSKNFDDFADEMDADFKRGLWYGLFSPTPVTPMSWWWEYFDERGLVPYFRGVRMVSDQMLRESRGRFVEVKAEAGEAEAYAVKCGKKTYVYVNNPAKEPARAVRVHVPDGKYAVSSFSFDGAEFKPQGKARAVGGVLTISLDLPYQGEGLYVVQ